MRILKWLSIFLISLLIAVIVWFSLSPGTSATAYDITTIGLQTTTSTAVQSAAAYGLGGDTTGTRMIVFSESGASMKQYNCTTGWDFTTCGYSKAYDTSARTASAYGNFLSPNGLNWYMTDYTNKEIERFTLGTKDEIDSATWNSSFNVAGQFLAPWGVSWSSTGTYMYVFGNGKIGQYYTPNNGTFTGMAFYASADISAYEGTPESGVFKDDGTVVIVSGAASELNQFSMSTGWNINTLSYVAVTSTSAVVTGLILKDDGLKLAGNIPSLDKIGLWVFASAEVPAGVMTYGRRKQAVIF
jgi:hypothetical protein